MGCKMEIKIAEMKDIEGILSLYKQYHVNSINHDDKPDGFVTTNFTPDQLQGILEKERGSCVFEQFFYASLESMRNRYPIMVTFINQINPRSYVDHSKRWKWRQFARFNLTIMTTICWHVQ